MLLDYLPIFSASLVAATSILLFITTNWRSSIILLALQYLGVFLLISIHWSLSLAVVKLVAGWMSGAVIGMAIISVPELRAQTSDREAKFLVSRPFYILTTLIILLVIVSQVNQFTSFIPGLTLEQAWGALLLISMGLLKLAFTTEPYHAILGLLTSLAGFEVLYAVIESSTLVAGLLAGITLGIALAGAYLLIAPIMGEPE